MDVVGQVFSRPSVLRDMLSGTASLGPQRVPPSHSSPLTSFLVGGGVSALLDTATALAVGLPLMLLKSLPGPDTDPHPLPTHPSCMFPDTAAS